MSEHPLEALTEALESGTLVTVRQMLNDLHPAEIARLIESFPPPKRDVIWELLHAENEGDVLVHLNDEVRASLIRDMDAEDLVAATEHLDTDDLADILLDLPDRVIHEVLASMDKQDRQRLEHVLSYPEDSAGGLMNTDTITVRADVTLDVVLRYLRLKGEIPDLTDSLIVVNRYDHYLGILPLSTLLTVDPSLTVAEVYDRDADAITATKTASEVVQLFENWDLVSAPVIDESQKLLGRITIDDVVDVMRDEADRSFMGMAGLDEEDDMFAPVATSARKRATWLGVNLFTAFMASWVIGIFEATLQQVVALAVLMPIVASMGGVAGTQVLTIMIRGLALGQVSDANARSLLKKEVLVGAVNGGLWALVVAAVAILWFQDINIGIVIGAALIVNLLCAAVAGFSVPLMLRHFNIDPALAGTVVLTTVTDVVGFMVFLGLGTYYLT